ncbi:MAG: hypothetical protein V7K48_05345 [Nostoc sp.]|uniref:hypothetical protein n=1 Tax=Nostoc sp. TaxID=1180 RepID=UPI002FFAA478
MPEDSDLRRQKRTGSTFRRGGLRQRRQPTLRLFSSYPLSSPSLLLSEPYCFFHFQNLRGDACGGLRLRYLTPEEKAEQERIRTEKLAWYLR